MLSARAMTEPQRLGKYRLLRRIAVGGVAEVYLASAEGAAGFEKRVVVKRLQPARLRDPAVVAMFLDEARLMALFHHPHVAEVYDIGTEGDERFFAMEHVDGCDLRDLLDAAPGEPLPAAAAVTIVRAVAQGLGHAHEQKDRAGSPLGVVHRDVSPSNVLLGRRGEVKLVDFGVAKWSAQRSHTEHGTLKGKFAYMSPEQCRAEALDGRSDLFALGVLFYELVTGQRPFTGGSDFELLSAIVGGAFLPARARVATLPPGLDAVISRALALAPADRFADAAAFVEALDQAASAAGITADSTSVARLFEGRPARTATPLAAELPAPSGPRAALDRTATDWSTPLPALAAPPVAARRRLPAAPLLALGGAVALVVLGLGWLRLRPPDPASPAPATLPVQAPLPARAEAPPLPPPAPDVAPAVAPAPRPRAFAGRTRRERGVDAPGRAPAAASSAEPTPAAPPSPPQPAKLLWDPDSPLPP